MMNVPHPVLTLAASCKSDAVADPLATIAPNPGRQSILLELEPLRDGDADLDDIMVLSRSRPVSATNGIKHNLNSSSSSSSDPMVSIVEILTHPRDLSCRCSSERFLDLFHDAVVPLYALRRAAPDAPQHVTFMYGGGRARVAYALRDRAEVTLLQSFLTGYDVFRVLSNHAAAAARWSYFPAAECVLTFRNGGGVARRIPLLRRDRGMRGAGEVQLWQWAAAQQTADEEVEGVDGYRASSFAQVQTTQGRCNEVVVSVLPPPPLLVAFLETDSGLVMFKTDVTNLDTSISADGNLHLQPPKGKSTFLAHTLTAAKDDPQDWDLLSFAGVHHHQSRTNEVPNTGTGTGSTVGRRRLQKKSTTRSGATSDSRAGPGSLEAIQCTHLTVSLGTLDEVQDLHCNVLRLQARRRLLARDRSAFQRAMLQGADSETAAAAAAVAATGILRSGSDGILLTPPSPGRGASRSSTPSSRSTTLRCGHLRHLSVSSVDVSSLLTRTTTHDETGDEDRCFQFDQQARRRSSYGGPGVDLNGDGVVVAELEADSVFTYELEGMAVLERWELEGDECWPEAVA